MDLHKIATEECLTFYFFIGRTDRISMINDQGFKSDPPKINGCNADDPLVILLERYRRRGIRSSERVESKISPRITLKQYCIVMSDPNRFDTILSELLGVEFRGLVSLAGACFIFRLEQDSAVDLGLLLVSFPMKSTRHCTPAFAFEF